MHSTQAQNQGGLVRHGLLVLPFAVVFLLFQILPMIWVIINSLYVEEEEVWGFDNYLEIFADPFFMQSFSNSLWLSFWSSLVGLVIASFAAASLNKVPGRVRDWMVSFTNMTSNFSGVPLAFAFIIILGFNGAITLLLKTSGSLKNLMSTASKAFFSSTRTFRFPWGSFFFFRPLQRLSPNGKRPRARWAPRALTTGGVWPCRFWRPHFSAPLRFSTPTPWVRTQAPMRSRSVTTTL